MTLTVQVKNVYGLKTVYPVCDTAKLFARIAGTTTLTRNTLRDVQALGYSIQVKQEEITF